MYKKFIGRTLALTMIMLFVFATIIIVVDPVFHYHKPLKGLEPLIDDERYQNPGIAKFFEYDSVLTGSSMTQNFRASEFNDTFQCSTVKLTYSAIRTGSYKYMFENAFSTRKVKNVFMGLDIDPLIDTYGNYYFPLPEYLYDDNIFNDVNYVLNKDIIFSKAYEFLKANYTKTVPDIDEAYMWEGEFSKENALQSVAWDLMKKSKEYETPQYIENTKLNLENNILPYIEEHPETTFYIFYPPYSMLWWNLQLYEGDLKGTIDVLKYASTELLKYENVKLYFFQDIKEIVTNLDLYKDYNHYNPDINSQMIKWMKNDEYRLKENTCEERISEFEQYIRTYDYSMWASMK